MFDDLFALVEDWPKSVELLPVDRPVVTSTRDGRRYLVGGKKTGLPSVTTILRQMLTAPGLEAWKRGVIADRWMAEPGLPAKLELEEEMATSQIRRQLMSLPNQASRPAMNHGKEVHQVLETMVAGLVPEGEEKVLADANAAMECMAANGLTPTDAEVPVWDEDLGYAGTVDILAYDRTGVRWVLDTKTGKSVWPEAAYQVAAYAMATSWRTTNGAVAEGQVASAGGIIHARGGRASLHVVDIAGAWAVFERCLELRSALGRRVLSKVAETVAV